MTFQKQMTNYLQAFIQGLISSGLTEAVISPGSRSTPLALLLHREEKIKTYIAVDERSAGFFALGLAKTQGKAVALLCTSGTAAANYYPAICEAQESYVPLVVITTDRPHELRQVGAAQAMDQFNLYQGHVKLFLEMALPEDTPAMLKYAFWQGLRSSATSQQLPAGPVHLNFPLREPLLPDLTLAPPLKTSPSYRVGQQRLSLEDLGELSSEWSNKKGLIIVGGQHTTAEALNFIALAEALNWPLIGDPLANLLNTGKSSPSLIPHSDLFIQELPPKAQPEIILQFGNLPLSKNLMIWLGNLDLNCTSRYLIDEVGQWHDQLKTAQHILQVKEQALIHDLLVANKLSAAPTDWLAQWQAVAAVVAQLIQTEKQTELNEVNASLLVHETMAPKSQLFVANSMPIRYLDRYASLRTEPYQLLGNRGINGIDGVVSSALGMTASQPQQQNVLLVGDLTLYHDMNGLMQAKKYNLPLTIVLLNNNGGGIFSFLSQNQLAESDFEPLFGTPLDLDFSLVAELYEGSYTLAKSLADLKELLVRPTDSFRIIEIKTKRDDNPRDLANLTTKIKQALAQIDEV